MDFVDHMKAEAVVLLPEGVHEEGVGEVVGSCYLVHLQQVELVGLLVQVVRRLFLPFHVFDSHVHQTGRREGCWSG